MNNGEYVEWKYRGWQFGAWKISSINPTPPSKVVIAFHGFDRKAKEMDNFMPLYDSNTSMLSISLLHHGSSKPLPPIPLKEPLSPKLLIDAKQDALVVGHSHTTGVLAGLLVGKEIGAFDLDIYDRVYQVVIYQNRGRLHLLHTAFVCNE